MPPKKYNNYDLSGEYGVGYTTKGEKFYFDLEDYDKIKYYCWWMDNRGYLSTHLPDKRNIRMHRIIMNVVDAGRKIQVDHKDSQKKYDNRKANLRLCNNQQNNCNKIKDEGFIGVHYDENRQKYVAQIKENCYTKFLGRFDNFEDALLVRLKAEKELYGEFAPQRNLFEQYGILGENNDTFAHTF